MAERITNEQLAELEKLCGTCTPGKWESGVIEPDGACDVDVMRGHNRRLVASVCRSEPEYFANNRLIAQAHNLLTAILNELREHRAKGSD